MKKRDQLHYPEVFQIYNRPTYVIILVADADGQAPRRRPIIGNYHADATMTLAFTDHIDGLVQERRNSTANALELRLSCTNPSMYRVIMLLTFIKTSFREGRQPVVYLSLSGSIFSQR